jgi:hypothetical protein
LFCFPQSNLLHILRSAQPTAAMTAAFSAIRISCPPLALMAIMLRLSFPISDHCLQQQAKAIRLFQLAWPATSSAKPPFKVAVIGRKYPRSHMLNL